MAIICSFHLINKCFNFTFYCLGDFDENHLVEKGNVEELIVTVDDKFQCIVCSRSFSQKPTCRRHIHTVHFGAQEQSCPVCQKMFKNTPSLRTHLRGNHGIYSLKK